jgi:phosphatidylglycerophosphatase A
LPLAPGTWGSLPPTAVFVLMSCLGGSAVIKSLVLMVFVLAGGFICVGFAPAIIGLTGRSDPREIVIDEFAGQSLTFLAIPFLLVENVTNAQVWTTAAVGFVLFRFFDIVKPRPIRRLEKLPAGWGILCDDLMAGLYAGLCLLVCGRLFIFR